MKFGTFDDSQKGWNWPLREMREGDCFTVEGVNPRRVRNRIEFRAKDSMRFRFVPKGDKVEVTCIWRSDPDACLAALSKGAVR